MIKSPKRNHTRKFLRYLVDNDFYSKSGEEFCADEVLQALFEKETRLAEGDFKQEMAKLEPDGGQIAPLPFKISFDRLTKDRVLGYEEVTFDEIQDQAEQSSVLLKEISTFESNLDA